MARRRGSGVSAGEVAVGAAAVGLVGLLVGLAWESSEQEGREAARRRQEDEDLRTMLLSHLQLAAQSLNAAVPPLMITSRVPNAASDGRNIYVNPTWVRYILATCCQGAECRNVVLLAVMVHEMAHHVFGDALQYGQYPHVLELRADYHAGFVLGRFELTVEDFERALMHMSPCETDTHPAWPDRVATLRRGYREGALHLLPA
jgi:hypothetical protein